MPHVLEILFEWYSIGMEIQRRRSKMRRTGTGRRIELTARDVEIFKLLGRYRYLRSTYIHAFVGGAFETPVQGTPGRPIP